MNTTKQQQPTCIEMASLKPHHTFGVEANARFFTTVRTPGELQSVLSKYRDYNIPFLILGSGSNVLFSGTYPGMVIKNNINGIEIAEEDSDSILLEIGSGENWHRLVMHCVKKEWAGIENLALIPGTVGAAPIQNIGAYGVELESVFHSLDAIHIDNEKLRTFYKEDCRFGYRNSIFKQQYKGKYAIVTVRLKLAKQGSVTVDYHSLKTYLEEHNIANPDIRDIAESVIAIRQQKLPNPAEIGNAGSYFKNPVIALEKFNTLKSTYPNMPGYQIDEQSVKIPAGWLIDKAGWKGVEKNGAAVHQKQALVLVNKNNAQAEDILSLAEDIKHDISRRFAISLEEEVNII